MSVVHLIDTVTAWADKNICQKVKLKLPADNLEANDARYHYTLVTPAAFATYTPTTEKAAQYTRSNSIFVRENFVWRR